ncbi:protein-glutamate methylesterase/protein-glutamine glutaminase [Gynuella sunshinyii]|uniref:Protein-glutamate methylesterase/protein-glutamine glutaminase n=1 Tax=Gynuella sunshinyii YC6258 TaxID=1445510 RepID=A0A0C5V6V9_9GAMM|nr:chemotaxis response regulator protein-glutamate methylesterase [Gynuella sunshinyii]AJQ95160.1 chemotaxis response regulator containing a CheY-like receiver domain and a methylesterase domain [Gynuella sunshinyii YC6258]
MTYKVLIVDDSSFFRHQIKSIIDAHPDLTVIGEASHGREAVEKTLKLKPDIVTMDYEMPLMDGITAVREIMAKQPTPILMFSSMTHAGARITLDALDAGAVDFLPKGYENVAHEQSLLRQQLIEKLLHIVKSHRRKTTAPAVPAPARPLPVAKAGVRVRAPELVMIGTSTGGPVALQKVLTQIPASFNAPILVIQHMPAAFTGAYAERLNGICPLTVKEAEDGDSFAAGTVLLAPGGKQMMLSAKNRVKIFAGDDRLNYKPCIDVTFGSAAKYYSNNVLAIVMTGMGSDGKEGARLLKARGAHIWAQEGKTCVIDGMPSAVVKADLADDIVPLDQIAGKMVAMTKGS